MRGFRVSGFEFRDLVGLGFIGFEVCNKGLRV